MRIVRVAIAGYGKVGCTIAQQLLSRRSYYSQRYSTEIRIVAVWRSSTSLYSDAGLEQDQLDGGEWHKTQVGTELLDVAKPDVLFEAGLSDFKTGGASLEYMRRALEKGCHVICISKGAVVFDGAGLRDLAKENGAQIGLSGAAGAALPCIDLLKCATLGCAVERIEGILNATSNYMLDYIMTNKVSFEQARDQTFSVATSETAESYPSMDIRGGTRRAS
jgi:homoserine dehydrogenase